MGQSPGVSSPGGSVFEIAMRPSIYRHTRHFLGPAGALALALCLVFALNASLDRPTLEAAVQAVDNDSTVSDTDSDGLPDIVERLIGSNPERMDTDADGYSDTEEVARGSAPHYLHMRPGARRLSVGMTAFIEGDEIRVLTAVYVDGGDLDDVEYSMGALIMGQMVHFPHAYLTENARIGVVPARDRRDSVVLIDFPVRKSIVHGLGSLSIFCLAGSRSQGTVDTADSIDFFSSGGVATVRVVRYAPATQKLSQSMASASNAGFAGVVHLPIPDATSEEAGGASSIPASWSPGEVCIQRSTTVGASGGIVTHEVVSADCVENWDSYCDPGCSTSIGQTYQTLDPVALVGG